MLFSITVTKERTKTTGNNMEEKTPNKYGLISNTFLESISSRIKLSEDLRKHQSLVNQRSSLKFKPLTLMLTSIDPKKGLSTFLARDP